MQRIFAHRGASGYAPENTLEAFELAAKQGAHGVELDVHLALDGEIVVTHDERIDRVSTGQGLVCQMSTRELKSRLFNRTFPAFENATIPTLAEVYQLLKPTGLSINVELKNNQLPYPGLEERCMELAAKLGMEDRVLYSSFNHYSMARMKKMNRSARCGLLYSATLVRPWEYAHALGVDALHPQALELLVPGECEEAHALRLMVNAWTIDDEGLIQDALRAGADIVITNYPDRGLSALRAVSGGI